MTYDTTRETFPSNIIANLFGFGEREYFQTGEEAAREPVKVKF